MQEICYLNLGQFINNIILDSLMIFRLNNGFRNLQF